MLGAAQTAWKSRAWAQEAPPALTFRSDAFSSSVRLLIPFSDATQYEDQSNNVNVSSSTATNTIGPAADINSTQVKWNATPNYLKSYQGQMGFGAALTYTPSAAFAAAASGTYVVEGWFYANNATTNSNWCLSSADSGGRWLFGINSGTTFQFGNENNLGIGTGWSHIAIVCAAGTKRLYQNAIFKGNWVSSNTGFSTLHVGQFNPGDPNDFRGHIQDLRLTIGSVRGYTGTNTGSANFTLPASFVQSF